jgi:hypothetical protein
MTSVIMEDQIVLHCIHISSVDFETVLHCVLFMTMKTYGICPVCIAYSWP